MNADEFTEFWTVLLQVLWVVFLLFGGYVAWTCAGHLKSGHGAQKESPVPPGDAPAVKPRRCSHTGADLEC